MARVGTPFVAFLLLYDGPEQDRVGEGTDIPPHSHLRERRRFALLETSSGENVMKINVRTTYTINDGAEKTRNVSITVADGFDIKASMIDHITAMSLAADEIIRETQTRGQIMVSSVALQDAVAA
jgi:hypothetical protein